jgi:hypothetical protein
VREDRVGIHPGDPILLAPDYRIDEVLSPYLCRSSFARLAPETKRNHTDDYCLFFDFLWDRGRWWGEASAGGNRVPVIAQLVQAGEDTVRDSIRRFNESGLACLDPQWAGGRVP